MSNTHYCQKDIDNRCFRVISEQVGIPQNLIEYDKTFVGDYGADSLDTIELVMSMEDEFGIEIPDGEASDPYSLTVREAIQIVKKYIGFCPNCPPDSSRQVYDSPL